MAEPIFVTVAVAPIPQLLTYRTFHPLRPGAMIRVPVGKNQRLGWVVSVSTQFNSSFDRTIKEITEIVEEHPVFHPDCLKLFEWCAEYYGYPLSAVIETAVPTYAPPRQLRFVTLVPNFTTPSSGKVASEIIAYLCSTGGSASLDDLSHFLNRKDFRGTLTNLKKRGIIELDDRIISQSTKEPEPPLWARKNVTLSSAQRAAVDTINAAASGSSFSPFLLHGVTGSGKTEVYIEAISHVLELEKSALIIVPEIALTPQLVDRFRSRIRHEIAILHSGLDKRERWAHWMRLASGDARVALGARSAVFCPIRQLGLIIVDEEHDPSFKQNEGLRYHGRDLAVVRAQLSSCPVVLGSATPSLESIANVHRKRYELLPLSERHSKHGIAPVTVVDMNQLSPIQKASPSLSLELISALQDCIFRGGQAFIFYNKRGFCSYLQCEKCGSTLSCPSCSITLTLHKKSNSLLCHLCGYSVDAPVECPKCITSAPSLPSPLKHCGSGTERVFEELSSILPDARIERLDRDTIDSEISLRAVLDRLRSGEINVLVGTQMIAKGHDLPNVTLVGVIDGDVGLHVPDFRASERVFQILTQVAGRAGRADIAGKVIIQTHQPQHPSIKGAGDRDFFRFAAQELRNRKELLYPPFSHLARILVSGLDKKQASESISRLAKIIQEYAHIEHLPIQLLGPSPAPFERIRNRWRYHCLIKAPKRSDIHRVISVIRKTLHNIKGTRVSWDVDPFDLL
jgi:primosomal protein N' (replication factor Y)